MLNTLYKKNKTSLQQLYGRPIVTRTLCNEVKSDVKIQINPQTAKQNKICKILKRYFQITLQG